MKNKILLINTGGTINAQRYRDLSVIPDVTTSLPVSESLIPGVISKLGFSVDIYNPQSEGLIKDSKEFTEEDIRTLSRLICKSECQFLVITHGTDKMADNAMALKKIIGNTDKVIIFVGSVVPLSMQNEHESDAIDNLRYVLENINRQKAGIYITARDEHNRRLKFFDPESVEKDRSQTHKERRFIVRMKKGLQKEGGEITNLRL